MSPNAIAALVNFLGFMTGTALYAMLLAMVLRNPARQSGVRHSRTDRALLATALLGLAWNVGALVVYGMRDLRVGVPSPYLAAAAFTALGLLPAVVVDSALWSRGVRSGRSARLAISTAAYLLSGIASGMHFYSAWSEQIAPSVSAMRAMTIGFGLLIVAMIIQTRAQRGLGRAVWGVALAVFAVSALHLSQHQGGESWWIELIGHQASLPLALAILYQDYRFALADIFLKRALALVLLVTLAFGLYVAVAAPILARSIRAGEVTLTGIGTLIGLWVGIALLYPWLQRGVGWFIDKIVLGRADYQLLRVEIAGIIASGDTTEEILDRVCERLKSALTAHELRWMSEAHETESLTATIDIPVVDEPRYFIVIGPLTGGRRLLSDDLSMLESVALMIARRLDNIRVMRERFARDMREQQISQLATEAELRALRAQLNPHFLFNALTTIGYLIQTAPERAMETLMRLTELLRRVLRRPASDFTTLGEELDLIDSYLAIERARFEERLDVVIDVPVSLRSVKIPSLVLQPLIENAVKHGIAPCKSGGTVMIEARLQRTGTIAISILDTGVGASAADLQRGRERGVGLANVELRLAGYYGSRASFSIESEMGKGTRVELQVPTELYAEVVGVATNR
jgi:two-component system, LytTR family, sensor kinase